MISSTIIIPRLLLVLILSRRIVGFSILTTTTTTTSKQYQKLLLQQRQNELLLLVSSRLYATVVNNNNNNDPTSHVMSDSENDDDDNNNEDNIIIEKGKREAVIVPYITEPLAPHTFAGMVEQRMMEKFGSISSSSRSTSKKNTIERIIQSWRLLEFGYIHDDYLDTDDNINNNNNATERTRMRQYCQSYVPGLTIQSFWDVQQFSWSTKLQSKYQFIRKELERVTADRSSLQERGNNIWAGALTEDAGSYGIGWKTLVLMDRGIWDPVNVNLFPVTSKIIHDAKIPAVEVFFASMEPQSSIQLHSDFTNFVLTCHLGLLIPESGNNKCRLTVGTTTQQWINGKVMIFDTSLMHDAVNDSTATRYILMLRIWHPDLTIAERDAIQFTYNCLDTPALVSTDPIEREQAEQYVQQRMKFPLLSSSSTSSKTGFGSTTGNDNNKRKSKSSSKNKK